MPRTYFCSSVLLSLAAVVWGGGVACNDLSGLAGKQALPSGTPDPSSFNTPAGALALYNGVLYAFQTAGADTATTIGNGGSGNNAGAFVDFVLASGLLTDELQAGNLGGNQSNYINSQASNLLDARQLPEGATQSQFADQVYGDLQGIRNTAGIAIGALATYDSTASPALRGHLYALQGYSELLLADLFCSGVPLSTLDYHADFTFHAGSTTSQLYQAAIAKFDTALALSRDSARILNFARIGKGRAWLDLGQYDSAAAAVDSVPMGYRYQFLVNWKPTTTVGGLFANEIAGGETVADSEGTTGLPYRSSGDPRSASSTWGQNTYRVPQYAPNAYGGAAPGVSAITVASWLEAQLIQAEAVLRHGDAATWLNTLNQLRTDGTQTAIPADTIDDTLGVTGCGPGKVCGASPGGNALSKGQPAGGFSVPAGYTLVETDTTYPAPAAIKTYCSNYSWYTPCYTGDSLVVLRYVAPARTVWGAGTGGVTGLAPLADPGTAAARIALMFRERAFWLYLTGHREGDLRRWIRDDGADANALYPTGPYPLFGALSVYGGDVTVPIPHTERANPLFAGCLSRGA